MRILSFIPTLAALATIVAAIALPDSDEAGCGLEIGCDLAKHTQSKRDDGPGCGLEIGCDLAKLTNTRELTNAERLRRGLTPKSPILRRGTPVRRHADPSGRPRPTDPGNPNSTKRRGVIQVLNADSGASLGYVSSTALNKAFYTYETSKDNALIVKFDIDETESGTDLNLSIENSDTGYTFLGLIQGRDDTNSNLNSGSFHYTYIGGIKNPGTEPGSGPTNIDNSYTTATGRKRTAESAVWTYDSSSGKLTPQWTNTDGSVPAVHYFSQSTVIYVGGDQNAFHNKYSAPVTSVAFKFVSL